MPVAASGDDALGTWYCPVAIGSPDPDEEPPEEPEVDSTTTTAGDGDGEGGTTTTEETSDTTDTTAAGGDDEGTPPEPIVERTVLLATNSAEVARTGRLRLFGPDGPLGEQDVDIPARSRWQLDLAELGEGPPAAALLEVDGGGVAVAELVEGPHGRTVSPCVSQPAATWYLPAAATTLDARAVLHLVNPFPDDAIVEIEFLDPDQPPRQPVGFEAQPIPGESVVAVDITSRVTVRPQISTVVQARAGQVVAAMVQQYDGSEGPEGLAVVPGAPQASETWFFPSARWDEDSRETLVLFNPDDADAHVAVGVALDDPETNGAVSPFEVTVPGRGWATIGSSQDDWARVPAGVGHSISVRSQDGRGVVAALRLTDVGDDTPGMALALGSPLAATRWIVVAADLADTTSSVAVLNPSPLTRTRVDASGLVDGEVIAVPRVELDEGGRTVLRADDVFDGGPVGATVAASEPVVVSSGYAFAEGRAWLVAVPVAGTTVVVEPIEGATETP
jgi:hypothetical protein